jgi:proteasome component ECM29
MDDIKETVRTAASRCGSSVANLSSKMCDKGIASPTDGPEACAVVIPYLLQQGLTATADEVREFALKHLIKISKAAGPWLRPHIPAIAPVCPEPKHANLAHARQFFLFY